MKKRGIFFISWAFVIFFVITISHGSEELSHPEVILMDYDGNEISLDSNIPYSPKNTCGECHDYDAITNAYHFQQGRTDAEANIIVRDDMDSKNPWLISKGMYGKW
jgi:hypothetical protein